MMRKFSNCSLEPSNVTLILKDSIASYEIFGFAVLATVEGEKHIELQPADQRRNAVMIVPIDKVEKVICKF